MGIWNKANSPYWIVIFLANWGGLMTHMGEETSILPTYIQIIQRISTFRNFANRKLQIHLANFITWLYEENVESGVKRVSTQVLHGKHEESSIDATSLLFLSLYCWNLYGYIKLISLYVEIRLASCAWSDWLYISFISVYEYINVSILVFNVSPTCNPKLIF